MWTFLTRIFRKNTKICDQCHKSINIKRDPALCLQGEEMGRIFEIYICEPCAEQAWLDSINDMMWEEIDAQEDRDNYPEQTAI